MFRYIEFEMFVSYVSVDIEKVLVILVVFKIEYYILGDDYWVCVKYFYIYVY